MTLLCIAPSAWWTNTTNEPAPGLVFGEHCNAIDKVVEGGITGYVLEGYGSEPFDAAWFMEMREVGVMKEMELAEI